MTQKTQPTTRRKLMQAGYATSLAAAGALIAPTRAAAASNGINALIAVTQMKSQQASEEAMNALGSARKQRDLIAKQKASRAMLKIADQQVAQLTKLTERLKDLEISLKEAEDAAGDCK